MWTQAQVLNLIVSLQKELRLAMAFITHDLSVVRLVCHNVMVLNGGKVVEEGRCASVFSCPRSPYTRSLIEAIPLPVPNPAWLA